MDWTITTTSSRRRDSCCRVVHFTAVANFSLININYITLVRGGFGHNNRIDGGGDGDGGRESIYLQMIDELSNCVLVWIKSSWR